MMDLYHEEVLGTTKATSLPANQRSFELQNPMRTVLNQKSY